MMDWWGICFIKILHRVVVFPFSHPISLGQKLTGKIQPDSYSSCYGTLNNEDDSVKTQS